MRKLVSFALAALVVLGVVGTAFAENGTIQPFKVVRVKPLENGTIQPF